jgi:6-phosphogluconolactonase (cycloisomerase 2 family)
LVASDGPANDQFGQSVAIDGETLVVGAHFDDDAGASSGSAYVFVRVGSSWTQQAKLAASDAAAGDQFGKSVAISGDTVVVGAHIDAHGGAAEAGSAYVFVRVGTSWTQQAKLTATDAAAFDQLGQSVAIEGDSVVAGARFDEDGGTKGGSVYAFVRSGSSWTQQTKLTASDDMFGKSVAISGDTVVAGARFDDDGGSNSGSAYTFLRSGSSWAQEAKLIAADAAADDQFGLFVAVSPDGMHLYATSASDDAVAVFSRNSASGTLTFVEVQKDGVGVVDGLDAAVSVTVSPDGKHLYAAGSSDNAVAVFSRNGTTGALTFVEVHKDGVGVVDGLFGADSVTVSPDGKHLYAAGVTDDAVAVFSRSSTGALTFVEVLNDGMGRFDGLDGANSLTVSPDGSHIFVVGLIDDAVAVFSRNSTTGGLTFVEVHKDGVGVVGGLFGADSVRVSPDGSNLYAAGFFDDAVAVFGVAGVISADLSVAKSDSPDPVAAGNPLTYTITVANSGSVTSTEGRPDRYPAHRRHVQLRVGGLQ